MTQIQYLSREIVNNKITETIKFKASASIINDEQTLKIEYLEKIPLGAYCQVYYNKKDKIKINRQYEDQENQLTICLEKFTNCSYSTPYGNFNLKTFGKKIVLFSLANGTRVLQFNYDLYDQTGYLNSHHIYLQIKN